MTLIRIVVLKTSRVRTRVLSLTSGVSHVSKDGERGMDFQVIVAFLNIFKGYFSSVS